jgi:NAD(P)-dependent dehydrogenase (short-subunit alcohol dehydrogenase family)
MVELFFRAFIAVIISVTLLPSTTIAGDGDDQKAVLITGATSGIGRAAAEKLAAEGYLVYAGARKAEDIEELNKIDGIKAVRLDVTVPEDIEAAVKFVESEGHGLWGLINNAGINIIDPLIEAKDSDLKFLFDVNVFGVFRVTKAFAPLLIESKGRIVNISSISGVLSGGLLGYGAYSMSKHAVEAYTDQLAFEMAMLGVHVSAIEPGNFRSEIGVSRCNRMIGQSNEREYRFFAEEMQEYLEGCEEYIAAGGISSAPPPDLVVSAIHKALSDDKPKEHYLVVADPFEAMITIGKSFEELLNLNHDHAHSYTREELIELMDQEWAILKGEKDRDWGE